MSNKLYVGNLSFDTTQSDISDLFSQAGTVTEAALINDKMTGRSRGFAFVTMSDAAGAAAATAKFNGADLHGRNLTVNEAKDSAPGHAGAIFFVNASSSSLRSTMPIVELVSLSAYGRMRRPLWIIEPQEYTTFGT